MINSITNTIESAKQAWRGLQALPGVERIARRATVDMERREAASKSLLDELAASRKHIVALEQQLAAACGGLKVEQGRHAETSALLRESDHWRRRNKDDYSEAAAALSAEREAHEKTRAKLKDALLTLANACASRNRLLVAQSERDALRETVRALEEPSITDTVG